MRHFIITPENITADSVSITGADAHHIAHVLRMKKGDEITVAASGAGRFLCEISHIAKETVIAKIIGKLSELEPHAPKIILAQALPKGKKMDDIIRMACEIGVAEIIPVAAKRCVAQITDSAASKAERWNAVSKAAAKQSKAASPTIVAAPVNIGELPAVSSNSLGIVLWEEESAPLKDVLNNSPRPDSITIVIGPEGGLTRDEVETLKAKGYSSVSVGGKILRTETAGVVAASMILYHYS